MQKKPNLFRPILFVILLSFLQTNAQVISSWQTSGNQSKLLQKQTDLFFTVGNGFNSTKVTINATQQFQTMDGFGWCMTEGSAWAIRLLSEANQDAILNDLFSVETGLGSATVRISIGASDLGEGVYTYQDNPNIPFSLDGPDLTNLIPILKKMVAINPKIKIMGSPWTAPFWMKTNNNAKGGSLNPAYYDAYADYFIKYFQAMRDQGIEIYAVTIQNEPENANNTPSMLMTKEQQVAFVNNSLGPKLAASAFSHVKLIAFDHNCDNPSYATYVCNNSQYIDGAAFHLYGGNISAMSQTHNATGKNVYFTEQWTGGGDSFSGDFAHHMTDVMIGATNNWSKLSYEWNVASDQNYDPHTSNGGCDRCQGAFVVNSSSKTIDKRVAYYNVAQMSKVTKDGSLRIASSGLGIPNVAFLNPDGSTSLVVYNNNGSALTFDVIYNGQSCAYSVPGNTAASLMWVPMTIVNKVTSVSVSPTTLEIAQRKSAQITATVLPENATIKTVIWTSSNNAVATVVGGLVKGVSAGTATITATTFNENKVATCQVTVNGVLQTNLLDIYNVFAVNSGTGALDVKDVNPNAGAEMQLWTLSTIGGGDNQRWLCEYNGGDMYYIKSKFSKLYLTEMGTNDNSTVQQQNFIGDGTPSQQWNIISVGTDIYKIVNIESNKAMSATGVGNVSAVNITSYNASNTAQQWKFSVAEKYVSSAVDQISTDNTFYAYPNPTLGIINLEFDTEKERSFSLYSESGEMLYTRKFNQLKNVVDITAIPCGLYIMQIQDGNNISYGKILKKSNM